MILQKYPEFENVFNDAASKVHAEFYNQFFKVFSSNKVTEVSTTKISRYINGNLEETELECIETASIMKVEDISRMDLFLARAIILRESHYAIEASKDIMKREFERVGWVYDPIKGSFVDWLTLFLDRSKMHYGSSFEGVIFNKNLCARITKAFSNKEELDKLRKWYLESNEND